MILWVIKLSNFMEKNTHVRLYAYLKTLTLSDFIQALAFEKLKLPIRFFILYMATPCGVLLLSNQTEKGKC